MPYKDIQTRKRYMSEYRAKNKDRIAKLKGDWAKSHPESKKTEYQRHRSSYIERAKKWRKLNTEKCRKTAAVSWKKWYEKTKLTRPEYTKFRNSQHYFRKNRVGGRFTLQQWLEMKKSFDYKCVSCGKQEPEIKLHKDHIVPLSIGGRNDIDNIQPLCAFCNTSKKDKTINYITRLNYAVHTSC